jgi:hypothetical protein
MAVGYTFVQAMLKAGRNPTRQSLLSTPSTADFRKDHP